jgi:hypothetical protein
MRAAYLLRQFLNIATCKFGRDPGLPSVAKLGGECLTINHGLTFPAGP